MQDFWARAGAQPALRLHDRLVVTISLQQYSRKLSCGCPAISAAQTSLHRIANSQVHVLCDSATRRLVIRYGSRQLLDGSCMYARAVQPCVLQDCQQACASRRIEPRHAQVRHNPAVNAHCLGDWSSCSCCIKRMSFRGSLVHLKTCAFAATSAPWLMALSCKCHCLSATVMCNYKSILSDPHKGWRRT